MKANINIEFYGKTISAKDLEDEAKLVLKEEGRKIK